MSETWEWFNLNNFNSKSNLNLKIFKEYSYISLVGLILNSVLSKYILLILTKDLALMDNVYNSCS